MVIRHYGFQARLVARCLRRPLSHGMLSLMRTNIISRYRKACLTTPRHPFHSYTALGDAAASVLLRCSLSARSGDPAHRATNSAALR